MNCIPKMPFQILKSDLEDPEIGAAFEKLASTLTLRVAQNNSTCFDVCNNYDSVCQPWGIMIFSRPEIFKYLWTSNYHFDIYQEEQKVNSISDNGQITEGGFFGFLNGTVVLSLEEFSCEVKADEISLICPCK